MEKYIEVEGKKFFYRVTGSGQPVVFLHGFAEDGTVWDNQVEFLKNNYRLIVPDLPGSGKSADGWWMTGEAKDQFLMSDYADLIKQMLDKEEVTSCILIGHSMGGYITLAFAQKYPALLKAYGLFHSSAFADSEEKIAARKKGIDFIKQHGPLAFLKTSVPDLFSPVTKEKNAKLVNDQINKSHSFSGAALISYYRSMLLRPDTTAVLKNEKIPVLFIMGEYDKAVPLKDSLKQCHLPERSYIHILKNSGHMGMCEEPDISSHILEEFLQKSVSRTDNLI